MSVSAQEQKSGMLETLKFKDADIRIVLQAITQKAVKDGEKVNILVAPEIKGLVTVNLTNVEWNTALEAVLKTYDFDFEWIGENIILVDTLESLTLKRQKAMEAKVAEPLETFTYKLKYLDAYDVQKLIQAQLTARGRISVLEVAPQKGWRARGGYSVGSSSGDDGASAAGAQRVADARPRSQTLVITDTKSNLRNILDAIEQVDLMPTQVLIEARIMEVSKDRLKDIGLDMGTGTAGADKDTASAITLKQDGSGTVTKQATGTMLSSGTSAAFSPLSDAIEDSIPYAAGLQFAFQKMTGTQFEIVLHALEEDVETNTLSAPRIATLDGQEAYIMIGEKTPIIKSSIQASDSSVGISKSLDYYQSLGIELNVVPQVCGDGYVNMILYPSVTSSSQNVTATSQIGATTSADVYPIIKVRETQTQILIKDGETIAIGGLLEDVETVGEVKVPILGDIPFIGKLFTRTTNDIKKVDLVIFVTVKILNPESVLVNDLKK